MAQDFTSTALINEIKRKISSPDSQDLYSDADFCSAMTDVQRIEIVPYMLSAVEGYFVKEYEIQTVSGTSEYLLPPRAVGVKIVSIVTKSNTERDPWIQVTQRQMDRQDFSNSGNVYCISGNYLRLAPGYSDNDLLLVRYYRRPSKIVTVTQAGKILSIASNTLTLDNAPSDWATGTVIDVCRGSEPFQSITDDDTIVSISGYDVTVADASSYAVGDWVCGAGQCTIPQIPTDLFPVLTSYAGLQVLESFGSKEEVVVARSNYEKLRDSLFSLITPRVVDSPKSTGLGPHYRNPRKNWYW